jgi:hypothetical protein
LSSDAVGLAMKQEVTCWAPKLGSTAAVVALPR